MKKKIILTAAITVILIIIAVATAVGVSVVRKKKIPKDVPMPSIAFLYTSTSDDYLTMDDRLYICSDGAILKASENVCNFSLEEEVRMVEEKRYEDVFEHVGDTNPETVQEMYNLFVKVVIRHNYKTISKNIVGIPERVRVGGDWIAYYEKDGEIERHFFYETTDEIEVSDKRALKIVDWMNEVLEPYKSPKVKAPKERTKEDYPIPGIAFVYITTWGDYLIICSDGKILKADDIIGNCPIEERVKLVEEENYGDFMEYVGDTDAEKVREMYDIIVDYLVLQGDHKSSYSWTGKKEWASWIAYHYWYNYKEEREITTKELYETGEEIENIDEGILEIVGWMNEVLEPYKQAEE